MVLLLAINEKVKERIKIIKFEVYEMEKEKIVQIF